MIEVSTKLKRDTSILKPSLTLTAPSTSAASFYEKREMTSLEPLRSWSKIFLKLFLMLALPCQMVPLLSLRSKDDFLARGTEALIKGLWEASLLSACPEDHLWAGRRRRQDSRSCCRLRKWGSGRAKLPASASLDPSKDKNEVSSRSLPRLRHESSSTTTRPHLLPSMM